MAAGVFWLADGSKLRSISKKYLIFHWFLWKYWQTVLFIRKCNLNKKINLENVLRMWKNIFSPKSFVFFRTSSPWNSTLSSNNEQFFCCRGIFSSQNCKMKSRNLSNELSSKIKLEKKSKAKDEELTKALKNVEFMKAQSTNSTKE